MFGDIDWPLNASRGLSAIAEFLVEVTFELDYHTHIGYGNTIAAGKAR